MNWGSRRKQYVQTADTVTIWTPNFSYKNDW